MNHIRIVLTSLALFQFTLGGPLLNSAQAQEGSAAKAPATNDGYTVSPIKHVIVIIGENRSFDHVYATYKPASGEKVNNLLSEGIINADGTPGPNFSLATTYSAVNKAGSFSYQSGGTSQFTLAANSSDGGCAHRFLRPDRIRGPQSRNRIARRLL